MDFSPPLEVLDKMSWNLKPSWSQFQKCFMHSIYVHRFHNIKHGWNWSLKSISPIFYEHPFRTKLLFVAFSYSPICDCIFWRKEIGKKAAHKMWWNLNPFLFPLSCIQSFKCQDKTILIFKMLQISHMLCQLR